MEIWKPIKGYEGLYEVSNLGRVKSLPRRGTYGIEHILKPSPNKKGYPQVQLCKNSEYCPKRVHRLVAENFIPNPDNLPQVNHIDGNKLNNNVENLEWCTNEYNYKHSIKMGLRKNAYKNLTGSKHYKSVIVNQFTLDNKFVKTWLCVRDIERELGFNNRNICACCRGKRPTAYGYKWVYKGSEI